MFKFFSVFFIWVCLILSFFINFGLSSWCPIHFAQQPNREFKQKTDRFWEYEEKSNTWVEVELPFDLFSCVNDNCTKVGRIDGPKKIIKESQMEEKLFDKESMKKKDGGDEGLLEWSSDNILLSVRKRVSLTKMSKTSIWITGQSGSIYERFWNGVQWVIAPHDLPVSAGHAVSVFIVNQTILALSEAGKLHQMQLSENSQPLWAEFVPALDESSSRETEPNSADMQIKSGVVSHDGERVYFCTKNGSLLELSGIEPPRWVNHGRPPRANVAAIADAAAIRPEVVFSISSSGDLYEYDRNSKPSWKKHIRREGLAEDTSLLPSLGSSSLGLSGTHSISLFLLSKGGDLVERRFHQRKWKWIVHGSPKDHQLTSITPVYQDEFNEELQSLFLTTATGYIFEYRTPKNSGTAQENQLEETWVSHMHPQNAKAARGISGLQFQVGRIVFPLDDGRLAELHISGLGGENSGPVNQVNVRKKASNKYIWSILDAPETEGWNVEYCSEERGPSNCITGTKDELNELGTSRTTRRRKGSQTQEYYLSPTGSGSSSSSSSSSSNKGKALDDYKFPENWTNTNFHLRVMHTGRSFFLITDDGLTLEYLYTENLWLWLKHDHPTAMKGALGNYNGSLFMVDTHGSLLIRERSDSELTWINCTAMRKGKQVNGGPPWDGIPGKTMRVTVEDALFFVSKNGRLLQFSVAERKFKWKDCRHPSNVKIASIIDQEIFRENIVFAVGRNGRLYQYNKVTELWHEHYQSQHLVLSISPGTAMRPSLLSLTGSIFMLSDNGGLVEYQWSASDSWNWVEHGKPCKTVTLVGSPGPCFEGNQLFLIGSDGKVYLRYFDQTTWKWKNTGFPHMEDMKQSREKDGKKEICFNKDFAVGLEKNENRNDVDGNCDSKVASTRPIMFAEDSVIFELRDGRLAEMRRMEDRQWIWSRTIGTPTSVCIEKYWAAWAT